MPKVFITGITGRSGMFFLREIAKADDSNYDYTFLVRSEEKAAIVRKLYPKAKVFIGNLYDAETIGAHLLANRYDTVFHIAGIGKSWQLVEQVVRTSSIKWIILVHTTGIYSKYKAAGEFYRLVEQYINELVQDKDIAVTILRPTMIYGEDDSNINVFIKMVDKLRIFPIVNHAEYELQPVWCGDLGKAYHQVLTHSNVTKGKNYNLSGGDKILLIDLLKTISGQLGVNNTFINVPFCIAYSLAYLLYIISFRKIDFRERVQRLVEDRIFDHSEATLDFGYSPINFATGVSQQISEYKKSKR